MQYHTDKIMKNMEKKDLISPIIICMIQARMNGKRLPGKVMKKINGKPIISFIVNRVSNVKRISKIVVVTSVTKQDDILVNYLKKHKIEFFRGSENNVLERFFQAAQKHKADYIIRLTADNPFVDPKTIDTVLTEILTNDYEYVSNDLKRTFPLGFDVEIFTYDALKRITNLASKAEDFEHVTLVIRNNPELFQTKNIVAPKDLTHPDWRLTVDEPNDLILIQKIMEILPNDDITFTDIMKILESNQDLGSINANVKQKT